MTINEYKEMIRDYVFTTRKEREEIHTDLTKKSLFVDAMQFAYIALNSLDNLEELAKKLIGTDVGIELDKILHKFHNFDWQKGIWKKFYMTFNDDNERHCDNAFYNHHYETEDELIMANERWLNEVLERNVSPKEIIEVMPEARFFMNDDMLLNLMKGE